VPGGRARHATGSRASALGPRPGAAYQRVHVMTACVERLDERADAATPTRFEPLDRGDVVTVLEVFDQLSPRSREQRFLTAKPRLTGADLRALTDVDDHDHVALVARDGGGHAIAIARFVRDSDEPGTAEAAVTVVDAWQGRGLGTRLARALTERARELGITRISLVMAHGNDAAARLMHRVGGEVTRVGWDSGSMDFEISLDARPDPRGRPAPRRTLSLLKGAR
jgi:RimJ/RimL family protein N-acetyltransferase